MFGVAFNKLKEASSAVLGALSSNKTTVSVQSNTKINVSKEDENNLVEAEFCASNDDKKSKKNKQNGFQKFWQGVKDFFSNLFSFGKKEKTSKDDVNGKIDQKFNQGKVGDCVLLSCVYSLSNSEKGKQIIDDAIEINYDKKGNPESYDVYFKGYDKTYTITKEELEEAEKLEEKYDDGEADYHYSTGDDDVLLLELAWEKACYDIEDLQKFELRDEGEDIQGPAALWSVYEGNFMKALAGAELKLDDYWHEYNEYINQGRSKIINQQNEIIMDVLENQKEFDLEEIISSNKKEYEIDYWDEENHELCKFKLDTNHTYIVLQKPSESENGDVIIKNKETGEILKCNAEDFASDISFYTYSEEYEQNCFEYKFSKELESDFSILAVKKAEEEVWVTDVNGKEILLPNPHAYGIKEYTDDTITIINPWDSSTELTISKEEFYKHHKYVEVSGYKLED